MLKSMDGYIDEDAHVPKILCMYGWMDEWMDTWMNMHIYPRFYACKDGWMNGC